jgi:ribose transport system permease protein
MNADTPARAGSAEAPADPDAAAADAAGLETSGLEPAPPEEREEPLLRRLLRANTVWIFLVLVVLVAAFSALRPGQFATPFNVRNIAIDAAGLLVISVGMTFVIITSGIDLSVGSVLVFSAVVAAKVMRAVDASPTGSWGQIALGFVACLLAGLAWGLLNGFLITKGRIPPLIVTLGTLGMALGAAQLLTSGVDVRGIPIKLTLTIGIGEAFGTIPWIVLVAAVVTALGAVTLYATRFGRYTIAIGSNAEAARRVGINVDRHLTKVYALSGLLAGLAGFLSLARFSTTTIAGHSTDNLQAIAAVVIGGTSLFGGIGTVLGTVAGVFIPAVLANGFIILGVQPFWQSVAVGAVLIAAVYVDQLKRRSRERE